MAWWSGNRFFLGISFLVFSGYAFSQDFPRDTSYTAQSTLLKVRKYHPDLEVSLAVSGTTEIATEEVVYCTLGERRKLSANIFYADANQNSPGVLLIHGGGWRTGDKSLMTALSERLARAGYVVMAPEYRLSLEAPFPAAVYDLKAAIRWMRANAHKYHLDTSRIAVAGCSAGGQLAALIGTTNHDPAFEGMNNPKYSSAVSAIIDIDGVLAFHHPDSREGAMAAQWLGGTYGEVPAKWEQASALTHVDETTPPTLFIGSAYPRFLAGREEFAAVLEDAGIKTETRIFEDAPHSFWLLNPWFEPTVEYVVGFLNVILHPPE